MYELLPFRFKRIDNNIILTNETGEYVYLNSEEFEDLINFKLKPYTKIFDNLKSRYFICSKQAIDDTIKQLGVKYLTRKSNLLDFTSLHMIVPTLRCNSNCKYCQVSSKDINDESYTMDKITAHKVVESILQCPASSIKIEFQGGEPLLDYSIVKYIIEYAERLNRRIGKQIDYVICTNLSLIDKSMLNYLKKYNVYISTSLDGPKLIHDKYRVLRNSKSSYDVFIQKLQLSREILGYENISALATLTIDSLLAVTEVIDEYVSLGFNSIFLRMLNPYGRALKDDNRQYSVQEYIEKYKQALDYILGINLNGVFFVEEYTNILLHKILTPFASGFVDLQNPSGIGISCALYNYNGNVYASDEGRMLAEMGDDYFYLGNVLKNSYSEIFDNEHLKIILSKSCTEILPKCSYCAFLPYCGVDPVRNYLETDNSNKTPENNIFCEKNTKIIEHLLNLIESNNQDVIDVFWSWVSHKPLERFRHRNENYYWQSN